MFYDFKRKYYVHKTTRLLNVTLNMSQLKIRFKIEKTMKCRADNMKPKLTAQMSSLT